MQFENVAGTYMFVHICHWRVCEFTLRTHERRRSGMRSCLMKFSSFLWYKASPTVIDVTHDFETTRGRPFRSFSVPSRRCLLVKEVINWDPVVAWGHHGLGCVKACWLNLLNGRWHRKIWVERKLGKFLMGLCWHCLQSIRLSSSSDVAFKLIFKSRHCTSLLFERVSSVVVKEWEGVPHTAQSILSRISWKTFKSQFIQMVLRRSPLNDKGTTFVEFTSVRMLYNEYCWTQNAMKSTLWQVPRMHEGTYSRSLLFRIRGPGSKEECVKPIVPNCQAVSVSCHKNIHTVIFNKETL